MYADVSIEPSESYCNDEEIRSAYRRLSMLFHPDRYHTEQERKLAQKRFHKISQAYQGSCCFEIHFANE